MRSQNFRGFALVFLNGATHVHLFAVASGVDCLLAPGAACASAVPNRVAVIAAFSNRWNHGQRSVRISWRDHHAACPAFTPAPGFCLGRAAGATMMSSLKAKWRNWQTHQTQNLAYFTVRVGSTPTFATIGTTNRLCG